VLPQPPSGDQWRVDVASLLSAFESNGYFAREWFACVDRPNDSNVNDLLRREYGGSHGIYPFAEIWRATKHKVEDDIVFDLIELLHDASARPRSRSQHSFGDCGYHWSDFVSTSGQAIYRHRINGVLGQSDVALRLASNGPDTGRLVTTIDSVTTELETAARGLPSPDDAERVDEAIKTFRDRHAPRAKKRQALNGLAGVLERHRQLLKTEMGKSEADLFNIANNFDIRHNKVGQSSNYGDEFAVWIYRSYLSAIELVKGVLARSDETAK